jgi:invasion protein IalB
MVATGSNVIFSVAVAGSASSPLPSVSSGTLQLWLKADAGVATNASGQVSLWRDQSGNANDASQTNAEFQPLMVYPPAIGGKAAVRFNGTQDNIDYLYGTGDVGVPNAMTSFTVVNAFSNSNYVNMAWLIGVPVNYGGDRSETVYQTVRDFTTWAYGYEAPFVVPTNTYRIWTDRINTNLTTVELFDTSASGSTNFSGAMPENSTPGAGYYVGGINPAFSYVSGWKLDGDIAEWIVYNGYLSEADRLAVLGYLQAKYYSSGVTNGVSFQWQFDGTNIAGATNTILTLTDVQTNNSGYYTVIVTNSAGSTTSSNAVLTAGYAPSITVQPQSQEIANGTNVTFTASATGTGPLSFQWSLNGANLVQATNSALSLTNVQSINSGSYAVTVSSPFGIAVSSNAVLTVDTVPVIVTQPQSQAVILGSNVTFSFDGTGASSSLPSVASGNLQLWLKADAGVVANASGQVSLWQDQSGNTNDASQTNADFQPLMVYPPAIGGRAAVRFNGNQETYLNGTGDVGVTNAMTSFTVVNAFSSANYVNMAWLIGVPVTYGGDRSETVYQTVRTFTTWAYGYDTPFVVPTNTYRIWTDRISTNLTTLELFDTSANGSTNFAAAMPEASTPGAGYYVGGLNPAFAFVSGWNLDGDIAEWIVYRGYLSDADRLAVLAYLQQKYYQSGDIGASFQWQFDGTNIAGATNATLTVTKVQAIEAGTYSVTVTDAAGSTTSSNAVLVVENPPSITVQPQSQTVLAGTNVTFTASATGTGPLGFQWSLNGANLEQATNSALSLTNVQSINAGSYAVTVSSPFGIAVSSNAVLTVDTVPVIETQPQSQAVILGSNVTFSFDGTGASSSLPSVASGNLQLWLKADAGVVANASGQVSLWQDQSGNTNDASQANTNQQPLLVYPAAIGGKAAVRFNGIQDNVNGDYMYGSNTVGVPDAMTSFMVYEMNSGAPAEQLPTFVGTPPIYGAGRAYWILSGTMAFSTWTYEYTTGFTIPTNTYRIWTDRFSADLGQVNQIDDTATTETNFTENTSGQTPPAAGYYLGGVNPAVQYVVNSRCFGGDIAELIYYQGYLNDDDRLAVLAYLRQKYYQAGITNGITFQWQFDGTNIVGATNATLTLTNVQAIEAGTYSVTVTDAAGSTTSSNAVLTTLSLPDITSSPANQSVVSGTTVTFSATATGTPPVTYQWQFDGTNIAGATNTSLTITDALISNAGSYSMVASSPYGSATSSAATLTVNESTIQVVSTTTTGGGTVVVSIDLIALGTESGVGCSLDFDPTVLTYTGVVLGSGASGGTLLSNVNQIASGHLGLAMAMFSGTFSAGTQDVFDVSFQVAAVTNATSTSLTLGNQPTGEQVSDPSAQALAAVYLPGSVAISFSPLAGDVSPRPNGNQVLNIDDWIQEGRFVAGLDIVSNGGEYQRADCAPRGAPSGGPITVADWVQVGRYAVGLDPLTAAAGPTSPGSDLRTSGHPVKDDNSRPVILAPLSQGGAANSVAVEMIAQGDESALQFSVTFNPSMMQFVNASLGSGAPGAALLQNTNQAASGNLGFAVGLLSPATFAAGTQQLVNLNFAPVSYSNTTAIVFGTTPIQCQLVDSNANILLANYENAALTVGGLVWPTLSINQAGSNIVLSWPSSVIVFGLQSSSSLDGIWTDVVATPATIGSSLVLTSPISTNTVYYRLKF